MTTKKTENNKNNNLDLNKITANTVKHEDYINQWLQDEEAQRNWLETSLEEFVQDGNINAFIRSLQYVVKARGRGAITKLAKDMHMDRSNVSDIINGKVQPRIDTAFKLVRGLGYKYDIKLEMA